MIKGICVSAPGKIILLGEHAVVYGKPALIGAVDKRCYITISKREDNLIKIFSKNFNTEIVTDLNKIISKFAKAQKDLNKYAKNNDIDLLKSITSEPLDYPQIIIGQFLQSCHAEFISASNNKLFEGYSKKILKDPGQARTMVQDDKGRVQDDKKLMESILSGFDLMIDSQIPIGSGMGSSAALAVAIAGVLYLLTNKNIDKEKVNEIAFRAEQKRHGLPSGGDNSACCYGGLVWFRKETKDLKIIQPIAKSIPKDIAKGFVCIFTDTPKESTGEMVRKVWDLYQKRKDYVNGIFSDQEELTRELFEDLINGNQEGIIRIIREGERNLEKIGVVSEYAKGIIRDIEKSGGAGKICGAGGKKNESGIVLAYHNNLKELNGVLEKYDIKAEKVFLGAEGLRRES